MDIYVLNTSFEKIGVIDYCASIIWTKKYCDLGDFELYLPATSDALEILKDGNLVMREDDPESLMVIQDISLSTDAENGNYITVSGPSIESYIRKRIVWQQTNLNGLLTDGVTTLLNQNLIAPTMASRKISNFIIGTYCSCDVVITKQLTGDNLFDAIKDLLNTYQLGFDVLFDGEKLIFNIYEGLDRSYDQNLNPHVIFSPEFDNILSSSYKASSENYKNVAMVAGEGEGIDRKTYVTGNVSGVARNEIYVDARDISSNTGSGTLTPTQYDDLLNERGKTALAETLITEEFEGEIEPRTNYVYGQDYFLGDIVTIQNEYGIAMTVRITAITEAWDENGYSCIPTFSNI